MTTTDLLHRLKSEAEAYKCGGYIQRLCQDAADHILALEKIIEGGDIGRKVMSADLDAKGRLVGDFGARVKELEDAVDRAATNMIEVMAERDMYETEVDALTTELAKKA